MKFIPIAVVAALDDEINIIKSRMDVDSRVHLRPALFTVGLYGHRPMLLVRSGIGRHAMARAMRHCLGDYRPAFCLHVGYCGGADPQYHAGDLFIAAEVVDSDSMVRYRTDGDIAEKALRLCRELNLRARSGTLVTVSECIQSPHEKAFAGTKYEAQGLDMESADFACACREGGVPYLVVRAVLDALDCELPLFGDAMDETGEIDGVRFLERMIRHPRDLIKLPQVECSAIQARKAIATFVNAWIGQGA